MHGAGDLCRCLGILAAQSRSRRRPSISSPSISCRIGRTFRSRRGTPPPMSIRSAAAWSRRFPGKEIVIGEVGWPSAGRMREGALPSPANQARVIQDVLALGQAREFPRQRDRGLRPAVEARAGRHRRRPLGPARRRARAQPKFAWGEAVSNHPHWRWQAAGGIVFAADRVRRRVRGCGATLPPALWLAVTANAIAGGALIGWSHRQRAGRKSRRRRLAALAGLCRRRAAGAAGLERGGDARRAAAAVLATSSGLRLSACAIRWRCSLGALLIASRCSRCVAALGLVFDPRYRDFPFAPLTAAVVPFFMHSADHAAAGADGTASPNWPPPPCSRCRCPTSCSTKASPIGSRSGCARRSRAGLQSGSGARRAKLSTSSPTASADSAVL